MNELKKNVGNLKQRPWRGRLLQFFAVFGAITLFIIIVSIIPREFPALVWMAFFLVLGFGTAVFKWGKQHLAPLGEDIMANDPRPPVVYLRSFAEEDRVSVEEEDVAKIMNEVGPFVGVGRPGDELPPLGASRFYVPDADWQGFVKGLLEEAALVLVMAGKTEGLNWEVRQCRNMVDPFCLAILIPASSREYDRFRSQVEANTDIKLPDYPDKRSMPYHAGELAGLVRFDENWKGYFQPFEKAWFDGFRPEFPYKNTRRQPRLRRALQAVCKGAGLTMQSPEFNLVHLAVILILLVSIVGFAFMILYALNTGAI